MDPQSLIEDALVSWLKQLRQHSTVGLNDELLTLCRSAFLAGYVSARVDTWEKEQTWE